MTEGIKRQRYTTSTGAGCPWVNGQRLCGKEGNRTYEWSDRKLNKKTFEFVPYKKIGDLIFGMPRKKQKNYVERSNHHGCMVCVLVHNSHYIGENGTRTDSTTTWQEGKTERTEICL